MNEQKQYYEELLEWCHTVELNWANLKSRFTKLFDLASLEEWEESCRQLKVKLQKDEAADMDDYETAKILFDHLEELYREANSYQEEINVNDDHRMEMEEDLEVEYEEEETETDMFEIIEVEPDQESEIEEEYPEPDMFQEEMNAEPHLEVDTEEQREYQEDLLTWCNNLYVNWIQRKPNLVNLADPESMEEWERLCIQLLEKLEADSPAEYGDYESAKHLYEQWELLLEESSKEKLEV